MTQLAHGAIQDGPKFTLRKPASSPFSTYLAVQTKTQLYGPSLFVAQSSQHGEKNGTQSRSIQISDEVFLWKIRNDPGFLKTQEATLVITYL